MQIKLNLKKTPLSSMSPVVVFLNEKPYLITGSPGGSTIITSVLQEILNVIDFQMSLKESSSKKVEYIFNIFQTYYFMKNLMIVF